MEVRVEFGRVILEDVDGGGWDSQRFGFGSLDELSGRVHGAWSEGCPRKMLRAMDGQHTAFAPGGGAVAQVAQVDWIGHLEPGGAHVSNSRIPRTRERFEKTLVSKFFLSLFDLQCRLISPFSLYLCPIRCKTVGRACHIPLGYRTRSGPSHLLLLDGRVGRLGRSWYQISERKVVYHILNVLDL